MAWNEPGNDESNGKKDKKDPWGNGSKDQRPPELDKILRNIQQKIKKGMNKPGGGSGNKGGSGGAKSLSAKGRMYAVIVVLIAVILVWAISGIFIVAPAERGVILRFGKYTETVGPGPHWIPRIMDTVNVLNVQKIDNYSYQALMLTKDENIVSVAVAVQYRISDPRNYLFNVVSPTESLKQATASSLRQVIGNSTLDQILTTGREEIREAVAAQIKQILYSYKAGVLVTEVALQPAKAPEEVKSAFDDAIKAQEDEQRFINQAQAYAMGIIPTAQGKAARMIASANAFKEQVVLQANAHIADYNAILPIYQKAPEVTRERMYLETMQDVLSHSSKVVVNASGGNLFFLPLNKLLASGNSTAIGEQPLQIPYQVGQSKPTNGSSSSSSTTTSSTSSSNSTNSVYPTLGSRDMYTRETR